MRFYSKYEPKGHALFVGLPLLAVIAGLIVPRVWNSRPEAETFLWASEQPEDFRFLEPGRFGIAYRSGSVLLEGDRAVATVRKAPMYLPVKGTLHSAVRIDAVDARFSEAQRAQAVEEIAKLVAPSAVSGVIVDFPAEPPAREFYGKLLTDLRKRTGRPVAVLAPESWCRDKPWIEGLPADSVIIDAEADSPCGESYRLSTVSPQRPARARRLYYVHDQPWTEPAVSRLR